MTSLQRLIERKGHYPSGNPAQAPTTYGGYAYIVDSPAVRTLASNVTEDAAMTISAVFAATRLIASTLASLPLHVFEPQDDGSSKLVTWTEDAYLWNRPNSEVPDVVFWETVFGHEVLNGNAYIYVQPNAKGEAWQLWPILPTRVQVKRAPDGGKYYLVDNEHVYRDWLYGGEIVHVAGFGRDGLTGISPIKAMALGLGITKSAEEYAGRTFTSGGQPSGVLQSDQELTDEQADTLKRRWEQRSPGSVAILDSSLKWQGTSLNPEDAQMLETRIFQVSEIARMFNVPEILLSSHEKTTTWGTGVESLITLWYKVGLLPHLRRFEATIRDELLGRKRTAKWAVEGLLRGSSTERAAFYKVMREIGVYSINEIRAFEELQGVGPAGDGRTVPLNFGPIEAAGESVDPKLADAVGLLIRAGFSPAAALAALGLPEIEHTGLLPITLQKPIEQTGEFLAPSAIE